MLPGSSQLKGQKNPPRPELQFVQSVRVRKVHRQLSWRQRLLVVFWFLVLVKCIAAHWAIVAWDMPVGPFWVWMPSIAAAAICTAAFLTCE